jgi:hypothetical protein
MKEASISRAGRSLFRVGILTAGVYLATFLFYFRGPQGHSRTSRELFAWFFCSSLLVLFYEGYRLVDEASDAAQLRLVIGFAIVFCVIAFFIFPFHSTDVFGYLNRGWQQVHYHQNPYVYSLDEIPNWRNDPMLREHWLYNPNPYGFLFTLLSRLLVWLGHGHWWLTLFLFKAVNVGAYALTAWIIWLGAGRFGQAKARTALYLFLWNPLILMHEIANGHNDLLTGCLVALAVYLALIGAGFWIIPALFAAVMMKYAPVVLIPFAFAFVIKKHGWIAALLSSLVGALLAVAASLPYLGDWRLFRLADIRFNATLIDNSLHSFLIHIFENVARLLPSLAQYHDLVNSSIKNMLLLGFVLFLTAQFVTLSKVFPATTLLTKSLLIMFVLICLVSSKFNGWYMAILLPLALLSDQDYWLRRLVVLITAAQLLSLTFFKQAYMLNFFAMMLIPAWIIFRQIRSEQRALDGGPRRRKSVRRRSLADSGAV